MSYEYASEVPEARGDEAAEILPGAEMPDDLRRIITASDLTDIYNRYREPVFGGLFKLLKRREDAEDSTHVTFERLMKSMESGNMIKLGAIPTWLFITSRRIGLDDIKSKKHRITAVLDEEFDYPSARVRGFEDQVVTHDELSETIAQVAPNRRAAFMLRDYDGLSHKQIAAVMGLRSEGASKMLAKHGRDDVKAQIEYNARRDG